VTITFGYSLNVSNASTSIGVVLMMPITFNTAHNASAAPRAAPANFEYRLNGDCNCNSSTEVEANCTIRESGSFQAHLMRVDVCQDKEKSSINLIVAAVLGSVAGVVVLVLCCYVFRRYHLVSKQSGDAKDADAEAGGNQYEGPVFVGRPVPVTPTMQPYAPMFAHKSPVPILTSLAPAHDMSIGQALLC